MVIRLRRSAAKRSSYTPRGSGTTRKARHDRLPRHASARPCERDVRARRCCAPTATASPPPGGSCSRRCSPPRARSAPTGSPAASTAGCPARPRLALPQPRHARRSRARRAPARPARPRALRAHGPRRRLGGLRALRARSSARPRRAPRGCARRSATRPASRPASATSRSSASAAGAGAVMSAAERRQLAPPRPGDRRACTWRRGAMLLAIAGGAAGAITAGVGLTAYTLGLRHAFDADHIAAIDNTTRKLMGEGRARSASASSSRSATRPSCSCWRCCSPPACAARRRRPGRGLGAAADDRPDRDARLGLVPVRDRDAEPGAAVGVVRVFRACAAAS